MNKKHEKSACCQAAVIRYGNRRRQCVSCKRTWSVWRKRRGRKKKRINTVFVKEFLGREISSLASLSRKRGVSPSLMQKKLKRSRDKLIKSTPWPRVPAGQLLMIADAVIERIERKWYTVYLMLVRSIADNEAIILPPLIVSGTETAGGWKKAMDSLPSDVTKNVIALVCDGHNGLLTEAKWRGWLLQRCQFHLLARIQSRRSRWKIGRHKAEAKTIFRHVRFVLEHPNKNELAKSIEILEELSWTSTSPEIRRVLSGFVRNFMDYRLYLNRPDLHLPVTNNTAESLASSIADLKHRMRGFPTLDSFSKWIIALLKYKKKIACNGFHQQN